MPKKTHYIPDWKARFTKYSAGHRNSKYFMIYIDTLITSRMYYERFGRAPPDSVCDLILKQVEKYHDVSI